MTEARQPVFGAANVVACTRGGAALSADVTCQFTVYQKSSFRTKGPASDRWELLYITNFMQVVCTLTCPNGNVSTR